MGAKSAMQSCYFGLASDPLPLPRGRRQTSEGAGYLMRAATWKSRFLSKSAFAAAGAVTLAALLAGTPTPGARAAEAAPAGHAAQGRATAAEAYAQKIRAEFGLRHDLAYVRGIEHAPRTSVKDLGTPLTAAESADIEGRDILSSYAGTVAAAGERMPGYAGE